MLYTSGYPDRNIDSRGLWDRGLDMAQKSGSGGSNRISAVMEKITFLFLSLVLTNFHAIQGVLPRCSSLVAL